MDKSPHIAEEPLKSDRCCADLYLRLGPIRNDGRIELRPNLSKVALMSSVSGIPAIVCFTGWLMYPWADRPYDTQMKWFALSLGIVLFAFTVWFSTAVHRFKRSRRTLVYNSKERTLEWCDRGDRHKWDLNDILGLQLVRVHYTSQLVLLVREDGDVRRALIHHDLHGHIEELVGDFARWTGLEVISDMRRHAKSDNNAMDAEPPTARS